MQPVSIRERFAKRPTLGALIGLAFAGALGAASPAAAQYYVYDEVESYGSYGPAYGRGYGYGYRDYYEAPRPPRRVARVSARDYGLVAVERTLRSRGSTIVDGRRADGARMRLIFDSYSGALVDRIVLQAPERPQAKPRVARVDPREDERPAPRIVPRPPERPAALKPPGQASAPATIVPPSPAAPARPAAPEKPVEKPPAAASAPATIVPASPAVPAPSEGDKPALVNPQDVRGTSEPERKPPLAKVDEPAITVAPVQLPPVQIEDMTTATPRPETPPVPVMPLE
jgi:hypothetical protein